MKILANECDSGTNYLHQPRYHCITKKMAVAVPNAMLHYKVISTQQYPLCYHTVFRRHSDIIISNCTKQTVSESIERFSVETTTLFINYCYKDQIKQMVKTWRMHRGNINHTENFSQSDPGAPLFLYWVKCARTFLSLLYQQHTHTQRQLPKWDITLCTKYTHNTTQHSKTPHTLLKVRQPSSSSFVILKSHKALHWGIWLGSGVTTCGEKNFHFYSVSLLLQLLNNQCIFF